MSKALSMRLVLAGAVVMCLAPAAHASYLVSSDTDFSYTGTVTNPAGATATIPEFVYDGVHYTGRDAALWVSSGAPTSIASAGFENVTVLNTAWYPTLEANLGWGNPNNTNTGFFQIYDLNNVSVTSASGHWNAALTQFTLNITGSDATYANSVARLWEPSAGGPGNATDGTFETYDLTLIATFADPATEELPGWYSTYSAPTSITGSVTGTFLNQNPNAALGLYSFDLTFQDQNWARTVGASETGATYFGAAVPEPAIWTMLIMGFGLIGLAMRAKREGVTATA